MDPSDLQVLDPLEKGEVRLMFRGFPVVSMLARPGGWGDGWRGKCVDGRPLRSETFAAPAERAGARATCRRRRGSAGGVRPDRIRPVDRRFHSGDGWQDGSGYRSGPLGCCGCAGHRDQAPQGSPDIPLVGLSFGAAASPGAFRATRHCHAEPGAS